VLEGTPAATSEQGKKHTCSICNETIDLSYRIRHEVGHTLTCFWPGCKSKSRKFSSARALGSHLVDCHNRISGACRWAAKCSEAFAYKVDLGLHLRIHNHNCVLGLENDFLLGPMELETEADKEGDNMEENKMKEKETGERRQSLRKRPQLS
jgi:hypothetical protein